MRGGAGRGFKALTACAGRHFVLEMCETLVGP